MRIPSSQPQAGIALIIVMVIVLFLGILAGGFAYSMKVETKLASNTSLETDLQWLGRSGVEMARYVVGQQLNLAPADALNQKWAGGTGNTNDVLAWINLENNRIGSGTFSLKIVDAERKFNLNLIPANQILLQRALSMMGVDLSESSKIVDSVLDWLDRDDAAHLNGAESDDYYLRLDHPYFAKNGPISDMTELLLIQGITPDLYWGASSSNVNTRVGAALPRGLVNSSFGMASFSGGLVDLFTTVGSGQININTASAEVLQLMGVPPDVAGSIVAERAGFDGTPGTQDDEVFINVGQLARWMPPQVAQQISRFFVPRSFFYEVQVEATIAKYTRHYRAMLRRNSAQDVEVLYFYSE